MKYKITFLILVFINILSCSVLVGEIPQKSGFLTESEAVAIARKHLELNGVYWGEPVNMQYIRETFIFHYYTPEKKLPRIGGRSLNVNIRTGEVTFPIRL